MYWMKTIFTSLLLALMVAGPALADDMTNTYSSGILVLAFVGVCALLVVFQLIPAVTSLFRLTKNAAKKKSNYSQTVSVRKH